MCGSDACALLCLGAVGFTRHIHPHTLLRFYSSIHQHLPHPPLLPPSHTLRKDLFLLRTLTRAPVSALRYGGSLSADQAVSKLKAMKDGAFMIRYSEGRKGFSLSLVIKGNVEHAQISFGARRFSFSSKLDFGSMEEFVAHYRDRGQLNLQTSQGQASVHLGTPFRAGTGTIR